MRIYIRNWYTATGDEIQVVLNDRVYEIWNVDEDEILYKNSDYNMILAQIKSILDEIQEHVIG